MAHDLAGKFLRPIQARADRRPAQRQLTQNLDRPLRSLAGVGDLLRVAAETLAEPDGRGVHKMSAADFDDVPKIFRPRFQLRLQRFQRGQERVLQLFRRADVDGRWDDVVARLAHVDVIVLMDALLRIVLLARQLPAAIRDHFVHVHVRARARTGLENVEREMLVQLALDDFLGRLHDEGGTMGVEQAEIVIGLRGGPFQKAERANKGPRKAVTAHRKIEHGPLRRGAVKRGRRDGHLAHRVLFRAAGGASRHAT